MKTKSRDYRKLQRARRRYWKALEEADNTYTTKLFYSDLHMKAVARWFFKKYPKKLPRLTFIYKPTITLPKNFTSLSVNDTNSPEQL